ncbi:LysR family transcriptional regulator [Limnohabitans sp. B9-3]|nr:LysR family transcriptional regulator [Limnohabitans sp. B9-3]PIT78843.1 LysR family transcriptional regulator [Limnohabitans sp. B9-3]
MTKLNLSRFDFTSIRLAVLCAQTENLTLAARECHLVLPAASRRIRELEAAIGSQLFERHSRGLKVTPAGRVFMRRGLSLLQEIEAAFKEVNDLQQGVVRHIQLFAGSAAISQFLPPLIAQYSQTCPEVQIDLEEQVSGQVVIALREGRADIGVFVEGTNSEGLEASFFRADELVLIFPKGHRLTGKKPILFADTLDEQWISLNPGAAMLQQLISAASALGKRLKLRMQVNSFDAVTQMVASGLGIALLPKAFALPILKNSQLSWRPLQDPWSHRKLMVGIRKEADLEVKALRDFLISPSQNAKTASSKKK